MEKLPRNLLEKILNSNSKKSITTKANVQRLVELSRTSKAFREALAPKLKKLKGVRNMYVALPKNRVGRILPLTKANMYRVQNLVKYPFMIQAGNLAHLNTNLRERYLKSIKNVTKANVNRHSSGTITFKVSGTRVKYALRNNGNLVADMGGVLGPRVVYRNVSVNNILKRNETP